MKESSSDDGLSVQRGRLLIDTASESAGGTTTEADVGTDASASETDIASDWTEVAGKQSQPAPRAGRPVFTTHS